MRWSSYLAIAFGHALLSLAAIPFVFVVAIMFRDQSLAWAAVVLGYVLFFPSVALAAIGLHIDALGWFAGLLVNSLCWAAVVYPLWRLSGRPRRAAQRRLGRLPRAIKAAFVVGLFGTGGALVGDTYPRARMSVVYATDGGGASVAEVWFGDQMAARDVRPPGATHDEFLRWWSEVFPRLCAAFGGGVGALFGAFLCVLAYRWPPVREGGSVG